MTNYVLDIYTPGANYRVTTPNPIIVRAFLRQHMEDATLRLHAQRDTGYGPGVEEFDGADAALNYLENACVAKHIRENL